MSSSPMKSQRLNLSEEVPQTITRHSSRLLNADEEFSSMIPLELVIEIFSRLPLKSIGRCRCVSKRWASILRRQDFTDLFFTKSLAHPQLLFAFQRNRRRLVFFSSPQPRESASLIAADHHLSFGRVDSSLQDYRISSIVNGLFCISHDRFFNGRSTIRERVFVICNPSTGQSFTLPRMKTTKRIRLTGFLGYDPIAKQHKVFAMTEQDRRGVEHQVLTLGTGNLTWRMAKCGIPHPFPSGDYVCISGVMYYTARGCDMVFSFDLRSEKYSFVEPREGGLHINKLINFKGKLASLDTTFFYPSVFGNHFEMWILDDPDKHEWSIRVFNLPSMRKDAAEWLYFVGVTATNEFVFSPRFPSYLYYYNFVSKDISRVEIQGIGEFEKNFKAHVILNHVEDAKIMELL